MKTITASKQRILNWVLCFNLFLTAFYSYAQPANDNPCSATPLTAGSSCVYMATTNVGATNTAGVTAPGCASYSGQDVWYSVIVPPGGILNIDSNTGGITDGGMAAYSGTCGALTLISCNDDGSANGLMPMLALSGLTPGNTIYIRFWEYGGGTGTFSICASAPEPAPACGSSPPAGNTCATATPICNLNGYCGNTSSSYTANSWSSSCGFLGLSDCGLTGVFCGSIENNSFLSFTASSTSISFDVWVNSSTMGYGIQILIFSANNCSGDITQYGPCYNPGVVEPGPVNITATGLTVGNSYYIMIDGNSGDVCNYTIGANSGISTPVAITPATATLCPGETVNLTASGGNGTYTWNATPQLNTTTGANVIATPPGAGTYTYTVNSATGNPLCPSSTSATATITVNNCGCSVTATNSGAVCPGGTVDLFATAIVGATYSWTGPSGYTSSSQNPTGLVMPTTPGTYDYTVTATVSGVPCTSTTTVTVNPLPTVNAGVDQSVCQGASVTLAGTGASSYTWNNGVTNNVAFTPAVGTVTYTVTGTSAANCTNTDQVVVTVNANPTVNAGTYGPVCIDAANITLTGSPVGGTFTGTGVAGNVFTPSSGTQLITYNYTDANSCSNTASTTITVNPLPTVSAGSYGPVCINAANVSLAGTPAGGTFSGTGIAGLTFTPSSGTQTITYTYTDGNSCTNVSNTTITVNPLPTVNAGTYLAVCVDAADVNLVGSPVGGTFTGTGVTGTVFDPSSGTQTVTYTYTDANSCTNSATATITVVNPSSISAGTYSPVCVTTPTVALIGSPVGGTFTGTGVSGNTFSTSAGTQVISYEYYDANGCGGTATTTITVNPLPIVSAGTYSAVCQDAPNVSLAGTPAGGSFTGTGVTSGSFDPSSGTQTLAYTYTDANGCTNSSTTSITVNPLPTVNAGTYSAVCIDAADVVLTGTPVGGNFTGTGVTGSNFDPSVGTQTVTYSYTDANSCSSSSTASITVNPLPTINGGADQTVCLGTNMTLSGAGGSSYTWDNGGIDGQPFTPSLGTTLFTVTGTDVNGCVNTDIVNVTALPIPVADVSSDVTSGTVVLTVNFTNNSLNGTNYIWNFGNGSSATSTTTTDESASYSNVGTYFVVLTASNGVCFDTDSLQIIVIPFLPPVIHVPNVFTPNGDGSNDHFIIDTEYAATFEMIILNRWGNLVFETTEVNGIWDGKINGNDAADGVYFYKYNLTGLNGDVLEGHGNVTLIR